MKFHIESKSCRSASPFYESIENGAFNTAEEAIIVMTHLEDELGWRNLRVVDENNNVEKIGIEAEPKDNE